MNHELGIKGMRFGFVGLGKMGSRIVLKLLKEGHEVVVWNRSGEAIKQLKLKIQPFDSAQGRNEKLKIAGTIEDLVQSLEKPRIVWSMLPAGDATENILKEVSKFVEKDDIVIDGGNSNFKDTQRRFEEYKKKGIRFLGIGVSGGIIAEKEGYPMMVGGDKSAYQHIKPILDSLAKPNGGYDYFGIGGAGHFVKMVHNGIEYGMMQSIGEGFEVLQKSKYKLDLLKIAKIWQKGTIISGFLMDRTVEALKNDPKLSKVIGIVAESGEGRWTVEAAKEEKVPVAIIESSLEYRRKSQTDKKIQNSFTAKLVAALRNAFGGHSVQKKDL
ncbi:MAG: decarboxylating 6-phosphogluconate dehydrogenase [Candidatus Levybacteria bacterium]|nr:decarboxylating 6-phosphogluconate dehydrogenase [Candidatus Levybacteria bacterium]